jgi:hypothetical protein
LHDTTDWAKMTIEDLPRPWLLAAMTGVPMSVLLIRAEQERAERSQEALREDFAWSRTHAGRPGIRPRPSRADLLSLAS